MGLLAAFKQYENTLHYARAKYKKFEKSFLEDALISKEEHSTLDQLADKIKHLEAILDDKKLEQTLLYVKKEVEKEEEKSTMEALNLLGKTLSQVSAQCRKAANTQLEAIYAKAKPVVSKLSSDNGAKDIEHDCGDYWAGGNPLVRISFCSPSCPIQYPNLDKSSRKPYVGEWIREQAHKGLFEVFSTIMSYRVNRIFKTPEWLGSTLGLSESYLEEFTGLRVRCRIKGETILLHDWYGKYKYDFWTGNLLAVEFRGKGVDHLVLAAPFILEYGLFDHNGTLVGAFEETWDETTGIGIVIDSYTILPEKSSGKF